MSSGYFSVGIYGQSGLVMDWYGLNDPFTQQLPVKITNTWSGTIWVQGQLISPPSYYSSYSGVSLGSINSGASATIAMTWNVGVSGNIATSSPITNALTLGLLAFTSSNYTGALASGNFAFSNTLFSRWSGVIKVFGDIYNNDQPIPSLLLTGGGTLASGQFYSYAITYILSGWESDIGVPATIQTTTNSNSIIVSWGAIANATQYLVWRWSGNGAVNSNNDFTQYSGVVQGGGWVGNGMLRPMDLVAIQTTTGFTDTNVSPVSGVNGPISNYFRHRGWQYSSDGSFTGSDTTNYLSPPSSRQLSGAFAGFMAHGFMLNKNLSGVSLIGPFYGTVHYRIRYGNNTGTGFQVIGIGIQNAPDGFVSGTVIVDSSVLQNESLTMWYRQSMFLPSSGTLNSSGYLHLQLFKPSGAIYNVDDIFIVSQS